MGMTLLALMLLCLMATSEGNLIEMASKHSMGDELMRRRFRVQHAPRAFLDKTTLAKHAKKVPMSQSDPQAVIMKCTPPHSCENDPSDPSVHPLADVEDPGLHDEADTGENDPKVSSAHHMAQ